MVKIDGDKRTLREVLKIMSMFGYTTLEAKRRGGHISVYLSKE